MDQRQKIAAFVEGKKVQTFITLVIIINAITLGLETSNAIMDSYGPLLKTLDRIALSIFVVEILLKFFAYRLSFFKDGWNNFDFAVVAIALVPASGPLAVLRSLRILRVLRLLSVIPQMRAVVQAFITAIPGMFSIVGLISMIFYVSAVLATNFYSETFSEWFGSLGASMYTLFQIMTLESWSMGIVRPVMEVHPSAWLFFIPFILVTTFAVINLFIGVIVDAMQTQSKGDDKEAADQVANQAKDERELMLDELRALRSEVSELKNLIKEK